MIWGLLSFGREAMGGLVGPSRAVRTGSEAMEGGSEMSSSPWESLPGDSYVP